MNPSVLDFIALRASLHRGAYHGAPPARGDPYPWIALHPRVRVIAMALTSIEGPVVVDCFLGSPTLTTESLALRAGMSRKVD